MAWYPGATRMELQPESDAQPAIRPTQLIVHSIVAPWTPRRTYEYWRDSTSLESHFGLGYDGDIAQYIGTETRADANAGANRRPDGTGAVSVETASNTSASDPWTPEQVEQLIRLGVWMHQRHGVPLRICRTHDDPGFGYHRLHREWSTDGTACPGDARATGQTTEPPEESDMPAYVNLGLAEPYTLNPGFWNSIEFTREWTDETGDHATDGSAFARGACRFAGSVSVNLAGLPVGDVVQVRMSEFEGDSHRSDHPIHEVIGTPGGTYAVVPLTKRLAAGRSMRVRLLNTSEQPVTVNSAVLSALVWKES
jgi:hypothetical protein